MATKRSASFNYKGGYGISVMTCAPFGREMISVQKTKCTTVQLSCKVTSTRVSLASSMRACGSQASCVSQSLQLVASELANSARSKQTTVVG